MSSSLRRLLGGAIAPPSGQAAQPPGSMRLKDPWRSRAIFFTAGDDRRDMVSGMVSTDGTPQVGPTLAPDGKTRCMTVCSSSGSGNYIRWGLNVSFVPGYTEVLLGRRLGNSGGAYDQIAGNGNFNQGNQAHGFLMNPNSQSRTYWTIFDQNRETGSGNGNPGSLTDLELTLGIFPAYDNGATSVTAKLYQGGVMTASRAIDSSWNKTYSQYLQALGSRGGGSGGPYQIAAYGRFQHAFTEADIAEWTADFWSHFEALP